MSATDNDENPFAVTATQSEAVEYAPLQFGAGFWICLLVVAAPLFALIPINFFVSIIGGQVVAFTMVRSVVYLIRAREFSYRTGRTPLARRGVALFVLSLLASSLSSVASWIAFVAVCTPLSIVCLSVFSGSTSQNMFATYIFFGLWIFSGCLALFLQWVLLRLTIPTTFEVVPTYSSARPSPSVAPPVLVNPIVLTNPPDEISTKQPNADDPKRNDSLE